LYDLRKLANAQTSARTDINVTAHELEALTIKVINPLRIELRCAAFYAMHLISLLQEELCEV
jgi:activator of 2-hydroxyglutaryl-CoA dehydratase